MARKSQSSSAQANLPVTKQTAAALTGAVVGSVIAGPAGAVVGGVAGTLMSNRVAQGKPAMPPKAVEAAKSVAKTVRTKLPSANALKLRSGKTSRGGKTSAGKAKQVPRKVTKSRTKKAPAKRPASKAARPKGKKGSKSARR